MSRVIEPRLLRHNSDRHVTKRVLSIFGISIVFILYIAYLYQDWARSALLHPCCISVFRDIGDLVANAIDCCRDRKHVCPDFITGSPFTQLSFIRWPC
ncbi:hypothetical protein BDV32DRAFT_121639 [Aspergillus pseudonomiae]|nr:hypothetical protein BDV32DRAFT_121639 [Aspergillus pseudonomiae]